MLPIPHGWFFCAAQTRQAQGVFCHANTERWRKGDAAQNPKTRRQAEGVPAASAEVIKVKDQPTSTPTQTGIGAHPHTSSTRTPRWRRRARPAWRHHRPQREGRKGQKGSRKPGGVVAHLAPGLSMPNRPGKVKLRSLQPGASRWGGRGEWDRGCSFLFCFLVDRRVFGFTLVSCHVFYIANESAVSSPRLVFHLHTSAIAAVTANRERQQHWVGQSECHSGKLRGTRVIRVEAAGGSMGS